MKKLTLAVVIVLIAAAGWWLYQSGSGKQDNKKPPTPIRTAPVEKKDVPLALKDVGTVVTYQSVGVRSRIDSQIAEIHFKDGDYVNEGDLLFVLDERVLKANRERDAAQLENLRRQYERARELAVKGYVSQADLDGAKAAYESQKALAGSNQTLLDYARIEAPISGRTGTINLTVGNTVRANDTQPLVVINQVKPIRVQVSLPQRELAAVREAMKNGPVDVKAVPEGGGEAASGTLEYIDNAVDQETGTFAARASFPNEDEKLWPGMFTILAITLGEQKNALTVPEVAVQHGQDGDYVFVIEGGKSAKRDIKVVRMQSGMAVIAEGLRDGETVAIDGLMGLSDGADVNVKESTAQNDAKE